MKNAENIVLENIISSGSIIRTKHSKSEWISNVVYKVYNNYLQVELTQDYINNLILVGDEVTCKFFGSKAEFMLDGIVSDINISISKLLTIFVTNINMFQNFRSYHRYDTYIISRITLSKNIQVFCIVTSISSSGISILSKLDFPITSEAFAEVFIDSGNVLRFSGEIVRKTVTENGFEFGVKFLELEKEAQQMLDEVLSQLKEKDNNLIKKYLFSLNP